MIEDKTKVLSVELRDSIKALIENASGIPSHYRISEDTDAYPYSVFDLRIISTEVPQSHWILTVDVWDRYKTWSTVDYYSDMIRNIDHEQISGDSFFGVVYAETSNPIEDPDKQIKHRFNQFSLTITERREE